MTNGSVKIGEIGEIDMEGEGLRRELAGNEPVEPRTEPDVCKPIPKRPCNRVRR